MAINIEKCVLQLHKSVKSWKNYLKYPSTVIREGTFCSAERARNDTNKEWGRRKAERMINNCSRLCLFSAYRTRPARGLVRLLQSKVTSSHSSSNPPRFMNRVRITPLNTHFVWIMLFNKNYLHRYSI